VARREFDVEALKNLVSRSIFSQVTEPKVKTSRMDALVELGKIQENVVDQVTKTNYYQQLRVK